MTQDKTITIGLAFPNALFMGVLFLAVGAFFISSFLIDSSDSYNYVGLILGLMLFILGLIPVTSFRKLKINKTTQEISYYLVLLFIKRIGKTYSLDSFDSIITGSKLRTYATGGGFLYSAKSFYKMKQSDIWILKKGTKNRIEIRNIGSIKKVEKIVDQIKKYTDYKY